MSTAIAAIMLIYLLGSLLPKTVKRVNAEISVKSEEQVLEFLNSFRLAGRAFLLRKRQSKHLQKKMTMYL